MLNEKNQKNQKNESESVNAMNTNINNNNKVNTMQSLLQKYEQYILTNDNTLSDSVYLLSKAIVFSILKKLYNVSTNESIHKLKIDVAKDEYLSDNDCFGDGSEIVQETAMHLLNLTNKLKLKLNGVLPKDFMDYKYETVKPTRQTVQNADFATYETVETTIIHEVFKAVRMYIHTYAQKSIHNSRYAYISLDELKENEYSYSEYIDNIYLRVPLYSEYISDGNIQQTKASDVEIIYNIIKRLNLNKIEKDVLKYRLQGKSYAVIGSKLHITKSYVQKIMRQIQQKYIEVFGVPFNK